MRFDVELRTIDSFAFKDVRAIKIDVEGSELAVLAGGRETILRDRPPLIVELLTGAHADPAAATETICATYGYAAWLVTQDGDAGRGPAGDPQPGQQHHLGLGHPQPQRAVPAQGLKSGKPGFAAPGTL